MPEIIGISFEDLISNMPEEILAEMKSEGLIEMSMV